MANGHGGRRAGAGAKKKTTIEMQANRRDTVLTVIHDKVWFDTVTEWLETARATKNFALLFPLLPYLMGSSKIDINVSGQVEHVQIDAAKRVLRVVGGTG